MTLKAIYLKIAMWCIRHSLEPSLQGKLPRIFDRIDTEMPFWMRQRISSQQMTAVMNQAIAPVLGRTPTTAELSMIRLLYDPIEAASNTVVIRTRGRLD